MSEQDYSTVITGNEESKGISGWWVVLIVTVVVLFCCFCISIVFISILIGDAIFELFDQITFQFA
jgi:hypothetical protein